MNEQKVAQPEDLPALHAERERHDSSVFVSEAALLTPAFVQSPALAEHLPFIGWLVEGLRPRTIVELATPDPTLFFGACQAAAHVEAATSCHLIGVADAAPAGAKEQWVEHLNQHYARFADLSLEEPNTLFQRFEKGTIDLLILHASSMEAWIGWMSALRSRLSERALVVVHGHHDDESTLSGAFGTPGAVFGHGGQLAVVAAGAEVPTLAAHLFNLDASRDQVHALFARLGQGCARPASEKALSGLEHELQRSSSRLEQSLEEGGLLAARLVARESEIRDLQVRLEWHRQRDIERDARSSALQHSATALQDRCTRLEADLAGAKELLQSTRRQAKKATATLAVNKEQRRKLNSRVKLLRAQIKQLDALYRKEQRAKRRIRAQLEEVVGSSTWRASAPLRRLGTWLKKPR